MKKQILFGVVLYLSTQIMSAQTFEWAGLMGGTNMDQGYSFAIDADGNVYTAGSFIETADFDPGSGTYNLTSAGGWDIFISKLDASGNFVWAKQMGGSAYDFGYSIAVDTDGNVYITGSFIGTADFDPGSGTFNMTSAGYEDIFVSKLDSSGDFIWAKQMGGIVHDIAYSIYVDAAENVYTAGYFTGTADFDPGSETYNLTSAGSEDIFISKLDVSGNFVWAGQMGGTSSDRANSITIDTTGNIYTTGNFRQTADFDPGSGTYNLTTGDDKEIFVSKLDASGNFVWAKQMGGTDWDEAFSIAIGNSGTVYTTGYFSETADFDPGSGTYNLTSAGYNDIFVSKLDASGNFVWAKQMGGSDNEYGYSIAVDTYGNVYTTGMFGQTSDFDPGSDTYNLTSAGGFDIFISKLDNAGNFVWAGQLGGNESDYGRSITVDTSGNIYTTGYTRGGDFDPGSGTYYLYPTGYDDIFVQKMHQYTTAEFDVSACYSYTVPSGNETYTESGTYFDTIPNLAGYDSLMTIHLTINTVDVSVTENDPTLTANATDATFQWLDCDNGFAPISGETAESFTATQNGNYAVEVSQNNCTDTSECFAITTVGISENTLLNRVSVYPNPNDGTVHIDLGNLKKADIKVFDAAGRLIYKKENINTPVDQFEMSTVPGIYILEINTHGAKRRIKLVKK